jgi:hypothetical protein
MAVDDEGRCYYYHIQSQLTQWTPPTPEDCQAFAIESSDSSDSESLEDEENNSDEIKEDESEEEEEEEEVILPINKSIPTRFERLFQRAEKRKTSGLVQERVISVSKRKLECNMIY